MCESVRRTKRQRISPNNDNQAFEVALTDLPKSEQQKSSRRKNENSLTTSSTPSSEQHNGTTIAINPNEQ
jgi:hypothetical protein